MSVTINRDFALNLNPSSPSYEYTEDVEAGPYVISYETTGSSASTGVLTLSFDNAAGPINFHSLDGTDLNSEYTIESGGSFPFKVTVNRTILNDQDQNISFTQLITAIEEVETATHRWYGLELSTQTGAVAFADNENTKEIMVYLREFKIQDGQKLGLIRQAPGGMIARPVSEVDAIQASVEAVQLTDPAGTKLVFTNKVGSSIDASFIVSTADTSYKDEFDNILEVPLELTTT